MTNKTEQIASKYLGKKINGSDFYTPELLVPIPRFENRKQYAIDNKRLPFSGWDVWQAYEFSALTENGLPVTRLLKLKYSCESEFLIESKSLKLYLNSYNMSKFGKTQNECLKICKKQIEKDLSKALKTEIFVNFLENNTERIELFKEFIDIKSLVDENDLEINNFKESPELLKTEIKDNITEYYLTFDSLRSNCRVTHQPDFGDVFIYYKSNKHIEENSLIKYLCSFRSEYHFHEECCEMIFKRLYDLLNKEDKLFVCALYTRRGGIDISPVRWSKNCSYKGADDLLDTKKFARNGIKQ